MKGLYNWWLEKWKHFEQSHEKLANWIYQIFYFFVFSMGVTVFQYLVFTFMPGMLGKGLAGTEFMWPQVKMHILGVDFTWSLLGYNVLYDAEGALLDFIYVTDLCTIFGNALDNAIESTVMIEDPEKRLIHLTVTAKKNFIYIFIENYCTSAPGMKDGYPVTTKNDKDNHGFGIKSICYTVEKYNGTVKFGVENSWFFLKILIPVPEKDFSAKKEQR